MVMRYAHKELQCFKSGKIQLRSTKNPHRSQNASKFCISKQMLRAQIVSTEKVWELGSVEKNASLKKRHATVVTINTHISRDKQP